MDIHQQMILCRQANHVVHPSCPAMAGVLYETGFHSDNSPFAEQWEKFTHLLHECMLVYVHPDTNSFFLTISYNTGHIQFGNHFCGIPVM